MALGHSADGGIAAHLGDEVKVHGDEGGLEAHARGSHGGLAPGVTRADHYHIVLFGESHPTPFYGLGRKAVSGVWGLGSVVWSIQGEIALFFCGEKMTDFD
jgi:hypothetical protein